MANSRSKGGDRQRVVLLNGFLIVLQAFLTRLLAPHVVALLLAMGGGTSAYALLQEVNPVKTSLHIARVSEKTLAVGVLFEMEKGWHIYWQNPGESGLPTKLSFTVPKGVEVGDLQWPIPKRYLQQDGSIAHGYEDKVLVWAMLNVPDAAAKDEIRVRASWVTCGVSCIRGSKELSPPYSPQGDVASDKSLFDEWSRHLPLPLKRQEMIAQPSLHSAGPGMVKFGFVWQTVPREVHWFPFNRAVVKEALLVPETGSVEIKSDVIKVNSIPEDFLNGLLTFTTSDAKTHGVVIRSDEWTRK